jgi:cyclic pyranopterin phosphate synthase
VTHDAPPDPADDAGRLTHLGADGAARMVDVSGREVTIRSSTAEGTVLVSEQAYALVADGSLPKGDALAVARIAGIMAAKRTPDLVPLCHPIAVTGVEVDVSCVEGSIRLAATVRTTDRTGVEMEALTAVAVAGLAVIDMVKAVDPAATITDVRVLTKTGGRHGDWDRGGP